MTAECYRRHWECSRRHSECFRMHAECFRMFQNACRSKSLHAITWACLQLCKLKCSYISLHEVTWACMQFPELALQFPELHEVRWAYMKLHELVCSSFLCLSSSQEFRSACLKEKPSKQRNKHSLETEVLNQVVTIWLGWINLLFYNVFNTTSQIVTTWFNTSVSKECLFLCLLCFSS